MPPTISTAIGMENKSACRMRLRHGMSRAFGPSTDLATVRLSINATASVSTLHPLVSPRSAGRPCGSTSIWNSRQGNCAPARLHAR